MRDAAHDIAFVRCGFCSPRLHSWSGLFVSLVGLACCRSRTHHAGKLFRSKSFAQKLPVSCTDDPGRPQDSRFAVTAAHRKVPLCRPRGQEKEKQAQHSNTDSDSTSGPSSLRAAVSLSPIGAGHPDCSVSGSAIVCLNTTRGARKDTPSPPRSSTSISCTRRYPSELLYLQAQAKRRSRHVNERSPRPEHDLHSSQTSLSQRGEAVVCFQLLLRVDRALPTLACTSIAIAASLHRHRHSKHGNTGDTIFEGGLDNAATLLRGNANGAL